MTTQPPHYINRWQHFFTEKHRLTKEEKIDALIQNQTRRFEQQRAANYTRLEIVLPDFHSEPGAGFFFDTSGELTSMLEGKKGMSIKRAVFLSENAYFDNKMSYRKFDEEIQNLKRICLLKMQEEGLSINDNLAKLMMIFRVITDEVTVQEPGSEKKLTHYPMKYDFNDYMGRQELSQTFVSKLLLTNTGQCHSLPLLFLILAEEMDTEAYLAFSPEHSFIKFKDKTGKWYNAELTRGALVSDDFYMNSGFLKAEAIKNKLYLNPLTKQEVIAHLLAETAQNYTRKYGRDDFVKQCLDTSLRFYPNDIYAHCMNADYYTVRALYVIRQSGVPSMRELPFYPQANALHKEMLRSYQVIDSLGFEQMPEQVYQGWLQQMEKEKDKPENQPLPFKELKK